MDPQLSGLSPGVGLSHTGLQTAIEVYGERHAGGRPGTLVVGLGDVAYAYQIMAENPALLLSVVPVPGLFGYFWFVAGADGIVWSNP